MTSCSGGPRGTAAAPGFPFSAPSDTEGGGEVTKHCIRMGAKNQRSRARLSAGHLCKHTP